MKPKSVWHIITLAVCLCPITTFGQAKLPDLSAHVDQQLDVVYAQYGSRKLRLDLFSPPRLKEARPAIVIVHGGGWLNGDKTKFRSLAQNLAARGYVTAAIEYRLGGEAHFPAAIHDCNAAVRWLRANASKHHIDPDRIGAVGGSAGGHLVGLMAAAADITDLQGNGGNPGVPSTLQAAIVMAGPLELATGSVAEKSRNNPENSNANKWLGKTVDEAPDLYRLASATTHLSDTTPPILFMVGELDNPARNHATRQRLRAYHGTGGILVYKDGKHGCWNRQPWFTVMANDMDRFFRQVFRSEAYPTHLPPMAAKWGKITQHLDSLELEIDSDWTGSTVEVPRLNNQIGAVYWKGDAQKSPLPFKPGTSNWAINIDKTSSPSQRVVILETKGIPFQPLVPRVISADAQGDFELAAHDAITHGELLRFEPQPHKNTVGYWANEMDWCEWYFYVDTPGEFTIDIWQGCGKGQGGSEVAVIVGEQQNRFVVEDTGHFQNFKQKEIGVIQIDTAGIHKLEIRPQSKAAKAVMDVRLMRLRRKS